MVIKMRVILLSISIVGLFSTAAIGQIYMTENGNVEFKSEVPLHSFKGTSEQLVGKISLADSTVDFYLDLATLDTGNNKRDKDMRETLDTEKHPFAEFFGKLQTPFDATRNGSQEAKVTGTFTIHGISRDIQVDGTLAQEGESLRLQAGWILNLHDYKIKPPGILFYRVDEEVDIQINALLKSGELD